MEVADSRPASSAASIAPTTGTGRSSPGPIASTSLAVLVLARDEADVLESTLRSVNDALRRGDRLHVVADHCRDATAGIARRAGAVVHVRRPHHGPPGKGAALRWWLEQTRSTDDGALPVVVLDADSLPSPGFLEAMRARMARGELAVQALLEPQLRAGSTVGLLAAFSEIVEQRVFEAGRGRRGWPVRLRGTGMAFTRRVLEHAAASLRTPVEDIELTLLLAAEGVPIRLAAETSVIDPKPADSAGAVRQRARWLRGQLQAFACHRRDLARLALRGPAGWSLLASILFKPRAFLLPLQVIGLMAGAAWWGQSASPFGFALFVFCAASAIRDLAGLIVGLRLLPNRATRLRVLAAIPSYFGMWLRVLALSLVTRERWLRSRPAGPAVRPSELTGGT